MKKFFKEFKDFISRGNVMDMAVGVIIGGAFSAIVTALTNKIIMPLINMLLSLIGGGEGLDSAYTFLKVVYDGDTIDLTKSIYIDWGAFITAVIDFLLIALVLFIIIKSVMKAQGFWSKSINSYPNKEEKKVLKAQGVNMKDYREVIDATAKLRADRKAEEDAKRQAEEDAKVTPEKLLVEIRDLLKVQAEQKEAEPVKEKSAKKKTAK